MPGIKISKLIEETTFYGDDDSPTYGIDMARAIYGEIPGDKHRAVEAYLGGNKDVQVMFE